MGSWAGWEESECPSSLSDSTVPLPSHFAEPVKVEEEGGEWVSRRPPFLVPIPFEKPLRENTNFGKLGRGKRDDGFFLSVSKNKSVEKTTNKVGAVSVCTPMFFVFFSHAAIK